MLDRWPFLLYSAFLYQLIVPPTVLWTSFSVFCTVLLGAAYLTIFISVGLLCWRGLPLNATLGEYKERARFLRSEVTRGPTDDDAPSG